MGVKELDKPVGTPGVCSKAAAGGNEEMSKEVQTYTGCTMELSNMVFQGTVSGPVLGTYFIVTHRLLSASAISLRLVLQTTSTASAVSRVLPITKILNQKCSAASNHYIHGAPQAVCCLIQVRRASAFCRQSIRTVTTSKSLASPLARDSACGSAFLKL